MFEFFAELVAPILEIFIGVYHSDEQNPAAQRVTLGCGLIVAILFAALAVWIWLR